MSKKKGSIEIFISLMAIMFIPLIIIMTIKLKEIKITKSFIEDGFVSSVLASATIDIEQYGTNNKIINKDHSKSYSDFLTALKNNLNLNDDLSSKDNTFICDKVTVDKFIIYNVIDNDIEIITSNESGIFSKTLIINGLGTVTTPDNVKVETATFYAKISFKVKGYLDTGEYTISKEKSIDVTDKI